LPSGPEKSLLQLNFEKVSKSSTISIIQRETILMVQRSSFFRIKLSQKLIPVHGSDPVPLLAVAEFQLLCCLLSAFTYKEKNSVRVYQLFMKVFFRG
jgi:hypothetical protein